MVHFGPISIFSKMVFLGFSEEKSKNKKGTFGFTVEGLHGGKFGGKLAGHWEKGPREIL